MKGVDPLDQLLFVVDGETFDQVTQLLDAPPEPNAGLERLMAVTPPWDAREVKSSSLK